VVRLIQPRSRVTSAIIREEILLRSYWANKKRSAVSASWIRLQQPIQFFSIHDVFLSSRLAIRLFPLDVVHDMLGVNTGRDEFRTFFGQLGERLSPLLSMKVTPVRSPRTCVPGERFLFSPRWTSVLKSTAERVGLQASTFVRKVFSAIVIRSIPMTRFFRPVAVFSTTNQFATSNLQPIASHSPQRIAFRRNATAWAKAKRAPKVAELVDLYWDGEPKGRSSDQAAGVPVPARW